MLWAWTALLSAVALVPTYTKEGNAIVPFVAAGLALLLFAVFHPGLRSAREKQVRADHPAGRSSGEPPPPGRDDGVVDLEERRRQRA